MSRARSVAADVRGQLPRSAVVARVGTALRSSARRDTHPPHVDGSIEAPQRPRPFWLTARVSSRANVLIEVLPRTTPLISVDHGAHHGAHHDKTERQDRTVLLAQKETNLSLNNQIWKSVEQLSASRHPRQPGPLVLPGALSRAAQDSARDGSILCREHEQEVR